MIGRSNAPRDSEYILLIVLDIILDEPARTAVAKVVHEFDTRPADHDGQPRRLIVVMSRHRAASIFAIRDAVTSPAVRPFHSIGSGWRKPPTIFALTVFICEVGKNQSASRHMMGRMQMRASEQPQRSRHSVQAYEAPNRIGGEGSQIP